MGTSNTVVAIVDDDPSSRRSIARLLGAHGFETDAFPSAEAFLERDVPKLACLVLDIHLEGMSGIALAMRMAASGSQVPTVFVTAMDDEATESAARRIGCVAYLRKPFAAELLIGAVEEALAGIGRA